ncbi:hypothetical protein ASD36_26815 [Rhizobium sp. Root1334]|uniref:hypothetical protein n=2 Tax=unclassified Rhizobium TaxID=2613769 RepID=UPI00072C02B5|nr:hypothetical protein [Rhizobium sp. Root1334]KQY13621.1 hypothetical protein ASD36_26815 [Rhizobium sp. Root1334]
MISTPLAPSISKLSLTRLGYDMSLASRDAGRQYGPTGAQMQAIADEADEKARAAKKIADAKEQLEFLKRGGFPPDVIARLAAQLAGQLQSAAAQLAQAVGANMSTAASASQPIVAANVDLTGKTGEKTADPARDASETNLIQRAYQSIAEDNGGFEADAGGDELLSEFESLIRQVRQLGKQQELISKK